MKADKPHLTHVALQVSDVERTIAFYRRFVQLEVVHDRTENGVRVVWLAEHGTDPDFVLVAIGAAPDARPYRLIHHLGYDVPSREAVDRVAEEARAAGVLLQPPTDGGPIVGYFCMLRDPDGHVVEISHGQPIRPRDLPQSS